MAEKQNVDFHDVDTAQHVARDGRAGMLELERAAQILDGEVDRLGTELDAARAENTRVRTALERLCCAVERDLNAEAGERAGIDHPHWSAVHDQLAALADECMAALDARDTTSAVGEAGPGLDQLPEVGSEKYQARDYS